MRCAHPCDCLLRHFWYTQGIPGEPKKKEEEEDSEESSYGGDQFETDEEEVEDKGLKEKEQQQPEGDKDGQEQVCGFRAALTCVPIPPSLPLCRLPLRPLSSEIACSYSGVRRTAPARCRETSPALPCDLCRPRPAALPMRALPSPALAPWPPRARDSCEMWSWRCLTFSLALFSLPVSPFFVVFEPLQ